MRTLSSEPQRAPVGSGSLTPLDLGFVCPSEMREDRLQFLTPWLQIGPDPVLVQVVYPSENTKHDNHRAGESESRPPAARADLPGDLAKEGEQGEPERKQIPPVDVAEQPDLMLNLCERAFHTPAK